MSRDYRLYLDDILEATEKIEKYIGRLSFDGFCKDTKTIDAVIMNFQIIGEATKHIPEQIRKRYSNLPWREMAGMRDKLIHEYFGIKLEVVWKTIKKRLPEVKTAAKEVLEKMNRDFSG